MKPTIFIQANKRFSHNEWLKEAPSATLRYFADGYHQPPTPEVSLSVPHPDGGNQNEILEFTFPDGERWSGTFADLQKAIATAKECKKLLNEVDTAFEVVRISWDNPTPQAVSAINEAWTQVRKHLGIVHLGPTDPAQEFGKPALKHTNQTVTLTDERRLDMLVGALEGGSNYWYEFKKDACQMIEQFNTEQSRPFVDDLWQALEAGLDIPVHDVENGELIGSISKARMDEGEKLMQEKHPEHFANILSEDDDAITADVWFQMVVLKELVYG